MMVSVGLHLVVLAVLVTSAMMTPPAMRMPERMTVSLAEDVGMESEAPVPVSESRAATAPTLSDTPAPAPAERVQDQVQPPTRRIQAPVPVPTRAARTPPRKADTPRADSRPATQKGGGSRLGDNFLEGSGSSTTTSETRVPASKIGASAKASIVQAVARQIKPHWSPPNGPEVDAIVSFVRFRLNPDGSLAGRPELVRQTGVNDTNRPQAGRHGEQAIRAVQLAAPFDLPDEYYEAWKTVTANLDWRLAQ